MLNPRTVTAVIPTRGDVDLSPIAERLRTYPEIGEIRFVIGDTPFNRYRVMLEDTSAEIFLTQDDDCVTELGPVLEAYERGLIVNAMTREHAAQYPGRQTLIGFGAVFHRSDVQYAFHGWPWKRDDLFYRESDRIFPTVIRHKTVFPEIQILPHANNDNRLWKQTDHQTARAEMNKRIFEVTGIAA